MMLLCVRYSQQYGTQDDGDDEYDDEDDIETDDNIDAEDDDDDGAADVIAPLYVDRHVDGQDSPVLLDLNSYLDTFPRSFPLVVLILESSHRRSSSNV